MARLDINFQAELKPDLSSARAGSCRALPTTELEPLFVAIQQVLNTLDPSNIPLPNSPPGSPTLVPPNTMATAADLQAAFEAIFGANGVNLTNALTANNTNLTNTLAGLAPPAAQP